MSVLYIQSSPCVCLCVRCRRSDCSFRFALRSPSMPRPMRTDLCCVSHVFAVLAICFPRICCMSSVSIPLNMGWYQCLTFWQCAKILEAQNICLTWGCHLQASAPTACCSALSCCPALPIGLLFALGSAKPLAASCACSEAFCCESQYVTRTLTTHEPKAIVRMARHSHSAQYTSFDVCSPHTDGIVRTA